MKKSILISLLALLMMGCQVSGGSSLKVEETTVEMRKNPEGVAVSAPRFSWQLVTGKQDVMQTAYQIEVAASALDTKLKESFMLPETKIVEKVNNVLNNKASFVDLKP